MISDIAFSILSTWWMEVGCTWIYTTIVLTRSITGTFIVRVTFDAYTFLVWISFES